MDYDQFLASKSVVDVPTGIEKPEKLHSALFPFQHDCAAWGLKRGRAAFFEGTGLGKTPQQCDIARIVERHTKKPVLIFAPPAVAQQTVQEAHKILGMHVVLASGQEDIGGRGVYITNYQKHHRFDPKEFGCVILDESSILKSEDGNTRKALNEEWQIVPFRYAFTATPAPNDFMEIGGHAEFLGIMSTSEMLSTFFVHDGGETQKWRLKGHAEQDFWRWMASWCVMLNHPRDLGYEDDRYNLPPLNIVEAWVSSPPAEGQLFNDTARTLTERRGARRQSIEERVTLARQTAGNLTDKWAIWCNLNDEQDALEEIFGDSCVSIRGSTPDDERVELERQWRLGAKQVMVSKASVFGYGMNWQHCRKVIYFPDDSWEKWFQAIRRFWRFGQTQQVDVTVILSQAESAILENLKRKEKEAAEMYKNLVSHMAEISKSNLKAGSARTKLDYKPKKEMKLPDWLKSEAA